MPVYRALREILQELSETAESRAVDVHKKFAQFGVPYEYSVLALQRPYTTRAALIDDVLNTLVHVNVNPLAQFAFAVHIQPFFNNIVSCSFALASLQPPS